MVIIIFNPFNKTIEKLEYSDLEKLISEDVAEGWSVEYKQEFVSNSKIAKSIASFANSEGGWYFIGIAEEGYNVASKLRGIDLKEIENPVNQLNNAIKDIVRPILFFKTKLVICPNGKGILVVYVHKGHHVPYLTNDGRIYQRIGESSDPHVLKDRYLFEKLLDRRKDFDLNFNSFAQNEWGISNEQFEWNQPYLEFYVYLDNQDKVISVNFFSEKFFDEVSKNFSVSVPLFDSDILSPTIHFDNHYTSIDSHILRYIDDNSQKSVNLGTTLELFMEGHFKLFLPFSTLDINHLNYSVYQNSFLYKYLISDDEKNLLKFIDLANSLWTFTIILEQYKRLLRKYDMNYDMYILINFKNIWRTTPFLDDKEFFNFIHENKLPINLKSEVSLPLYGNYIKLNLHDFNSQNFLLEIASVLGFPKHLSKSFSRCFINYLTSNAKSDAEGI